MLLVARASFLLSLVEQPFASTDDSRWLCFVSSSCCMDLLYLFHEYHPLGRLSYALAVLQYAGVWFVSLLVCLLSGSLSTCQRFSLTVVSNSVFLRMVQMYLHSRHPLCEHRQIILLVKLCYLQEQQHSRQLLTLRVNLSVLQR